MSGATKVQAQFGLEDVRACLSSEGAIWMLVLLLGIQSLKCWTLRHYKAMWASGITTYANVSWRSMLHCHWTDSGSITPNLTGRGLCHCFNVFVLKRPVHFVIFERVYIVCRILNLCILVSWQFTWCSRIKKKWNDTDCFCAFCSRVETWRTWLTWLRMTPHPPFFKCQLFYIYI